MYISKLWEGDLLQKWENDVHLSYRRSNINGPGTPRPLNRPKVSLSVPMTTNGLPESADSKESNLQQNEDKNHRFVCDLYFKTNMFSKKVDVYWLFSALIIYCCFEEHRKVLVCFTGAVCGFWKFPVLVYDEDDHRKGWKLLIWGDPIYSRVLRK